MERKAPVIPDLSEKGGLKDGQPQSSNQRMFMQLLAFTGCMDLGPVIETVKGIGLNAAVYADVNDPYGFAVLTMTQDPDDFVTKVRPALAHSFADLKAKPEYTMLGRTYSIGYEPDLEETLLKRPVRTALNPAWNWVVWYPLRRSGAFMKLTPDEQKAILGEHGQIGMSFGAGDLAHDIRLACHGLDPNDNDFVIGLTGKDLFPLSAIVQTMRKTRQTSEFLTHLGPFFVGKAVFKTGAGAGV